MAWALEERVAGYVAMVRHGFVRIHPYFAAGFEKKYPELIEAALSEGVISGRYADILRRALAGENYSEMARGGGLKGKDVPRSAMWIYHGKTLKRLREYVSKNQERFDNLHLIEREEVLIGEELRSATTDEKRLHMAYLAQRQRSERAEARVAELEALLAEPGGRGAGMEGNILNTYKADARYHEMPIDDFGVLTHGINTLKRNYVKNVGELTELSEKELRKFKNAGPKNIQSIRTALGYLGLSLRGSETVPFPTGEALAQSPTSIIFGGSIITRNLAEGNINNMKQFANAPEEKLKELLGREGYEVALRMMNYYSEELQRLRAA